MGRQNGDATVASSSIALLQERFRELQRIREKRREKELLKLFSSESEKRKSNSSSCSSSSSSSGASAGMHFEPNKLTFQPEMILPNRAPALQDSFLSLRLNSQSNNHADIRALDTPTSLWPNTSTGSSSPRTNFEHSDVDTSLHL
ncbi:hypothetical protein RCOM_0483300 [Ricinus communis]|uniref:Uncharacterized protein n=1 Tax=Ricinus communis TaxID=3988 RepID=B9T0C6_RICCO|nr:hypothetical protein RCOM_0483300 [Ricinus communis]